MAALALALATGSTGCSLYGQNSVPAEQVLAARIDDLDAESLALAAERTAAALAKQAKHAKQPARSTTDPAPAARLGGRLYSAEELAASARHVAEIARSEPDPRALTQRLARDCRAFPAGEPAKVTGYFEPMLAARGAPDRRFRFPLFRMPSPAEFASLRESLGRVPTRADIDDGGALDNLELELAWVDDPVALFFLHVQGSGRLSFEDGKTVGVGFAGTNDLPYRSVGQAMLEQGLLEPGDASATAMRRWLAAHPERRDELLWLNPRYVFFRSTGDQGPFGALGATLVPGRSIAADARHIPRGALLWLRSTRPVVDDKGRLLAKEPLTRFVFAQDAGAAIQGPARVDLFVGSGEQAGIEAGGMNETGELSVLVCRKPRWWKLRASSRGTPMRLHGP